ncbi:LacI family transcriptional regulator [Pseudoclavibacter chungangensis]|uniref:LacI family transcriptional regulator n=1 Tax=Pseudoclavibacter chungangensis TaxID=587635 RepID=A0A7J5BWU7_9MICO|nr:LacI family DNA-binding transcriptional regulator [Pseudoclavibacter chungangensis]KAB1658021.1 LacI family transcriptional regulator [Pseudoclavibacter chungangensis]NYJ65814.1 LacI family transcriptional regulator [Pseudoclavibacter chungangensis]
MARESTRRVTIQHVADEAEVSIATVSRVVNGDAKVSPVLAERVREVAGRLGYRPFAAARDLASGHYRSIGVVVPDLGNPYFYDVIKATSVGASAEGYRLVISDSGDDPAVELSIARERLSQVDGLLLLSSRIDADGLATLARATTPVTLVNRVDPESGLPAVAVDNFSAMLGLCHHLSVLGHRRVVYLAGSANAWQNRERWRAIEQARVMGLEATRIDVAATIESGVAHAEAALETKPTAIICCNDLIAVGLLTRLRELGVRVPEDVSVTGFDDIDFAQHTVPTLTTAVSPRAELGDRSWRVLRALLAGEQPPAVPLLLATVVHRGSTGPARD